MKKMAKISLIGFIGAFTVYVGGLFSQTPTYYCDIRNESFIAQNVFEFDVYLTRTGTTPLQLACFEAGINLNSSFVNGGSITPVILTGSELLPSQVPTSIAFDASSNCLKLAPQKPPRDYATGVVTATEIDGVTGTKVCRIQLNNSNDFGADPANYTWNMSPDPYRTVVSAFLPGAPPVNSAITSAQSQSVSNNLVLYLEGLCASGANNKAQDDMGDHFGGPVADQITIKLVNASSHAIDYFSTPANLYTNGKCSFSAPASISGSYYIVVNHRNSIETWSADPVTFGGGLVSYDFSDNAAKAYASNMIEKDGVWAFYAGDVNQDGLVDSGDMNEVDNGSTAILMGYYPSDVNGDGLVDSGDMNTVDNNSTAIVMVQAPF